MERKIRLRNGILEDGGAPAGARPGARLAALREEVARADRQRLQGVWSLVSGAVNGRPASQDTKVRWTVAGDQVTVEMDDRWVGKCTLDPSATPKRINLAVTSSDGTKEDIRGVYEVRGGRLCLCLAMGDEPRPESLRSSQGKNQISLALKRQPR